MGKEVIISRAEEALWLAAVNLANKYCLTYSIPLERIGNISERVLADKPYSIFILHCNFISLHATRTVTFSVFYR